MIFYEIQLRRAETMTTKTMTHHREASFASKESAGSTINRCRIRHAVRDGYYRVFVIGDLDARHTQRIDALAMARMQRVSFNNANNALRTSNISRSIDFFEKKKTGRSAASTFLKITSCPLYASRVGFKIDRQTTLVIASSRCWVCDAVRPYKCPATRKQRDRPRSKSN